MKLPVANMFLFWKLFRETDFSAIEQSATRHVRLAVTGETPADRLAVIETLGRGDASLFAADPAAAHGTLALTRESGTLLAHVTKRDEANPADPIMLPGLERDHIDQYLTPHIAAHLAEDHLIALARRLPALRDAAAQRLVWEAATGNAQFATVTNIADLVPILGPLVGAAADLLVLTKNQVMLVYKLAAIHGKPLGSKKAIAAEIAPVLGGAFVWRSLARELAGLVPFGLGIVPKVAIAFAGTFTVGQAAHFYFSTGQKPPKDVAEHMYRDALTRAKRLWPAKAKAAGNQPTTVTTAYPVSTNGASHGPSLSKH